MIAEAVIILLIHETPLNRPLNVLMTSFFQFIMGYATLDQFHPDSIGFCIFLSIAYAAVTGLVLWINLEKWDFNDDDRNLFFRILSGVMYGASAMLITFPVFGGVWFKYFEQGGVYSFAAGIIMLALAVGAGIAGGVNDV